MTKQNIQTAKLIIATSKALKAFRIGDFNIALHLSATSLAGRAGLLGSALRGHDALDVQSFVIIAGTEGFSPIELKTIIYPWLESQMLCHITRADGEVLSIRSLILTYDQLLESVYALWESLDPHDVDRACLQAVSECNLLPMGRAELVQKLAHVHGEKNATIALDLINAYKLLGKVERGLIEPLYYSVNVWKNAISSAAQHLSLLNVTDKEVLLNMINQVKSYQGMPEALLAKFARDHNAKHILDLAIQTGLFDRTVIRTADGTERAFLLTPHFYADVEADHGEDFCDRVKIFLDSIRNGQHFGHRATGKIGDPDRLLEVLLNRGWVGPASSIGTGYILPEKSGIVRVERDNNYQDNRFKLFLVQEDTVSVVHQIIKTGTAEPGRVQMKASDLQADEASFSAAETVRATIGDLPSQVLEAEAEIMRVLRESGCRT